MLTDPSIEKLKQKGESPYDVAVLVSKRARQLVNGACCPDHTRGASEKTEGRRG